MVRTHTVDKSRAVLDLYVLLRQKERINQYKANIQEANTYCARNEGQIDRELEALRIRCGFSESDASDAASKKSKPEGPRKKSSMAIDY
jgi:hypothetical protein